MNSLENVLGCGLCQVLEIWILFIGLLSVIFTGMTAVLFFSEKCEALKGMFLIVVFLALLALSLILTGSLGIMLAFSVILLVVAGVCFLAWLISCFSREERSARRFELIYMAIGIGIVGILHLVIMADMTASI